MTTILSDYNVNEATMILLPAAHIDYHTIVLEKDQQLFVKKTPFQIIKSSCLTNWSTYEGRRMAVQYHLGFKREVPIPISRSKNIYTFPTHAQNDFYCCWVFYHHILQIAQDTSSHTGSIIYFKNGGMLPILVSKHILEKQIQRTLACVAGGTAYENSY